MTVVDMRCGCRFSPGLVVLCDDAWGFVEGMRQADATGAMPELFKHEAWKLLREHHRKNGAREAQMSRVFNAQRKRQFTLARVGGQVIG